jgi:hypothetical protein
MIPLYDSTFREERTGESSGRQAAEPDSSETWP